MTQRLAILKLGSWLMIILIASVATRSVMADTILAPGSPTFSPLNTGPNTQQKTGSLLIGSDTLTESLCLNPGASGEADPVNCVSSWVKVLGFSNAHVSLTSTLLSVNGNLPAAPVPDGIDPAKYIPLQLGYINLTSKVKQAITAIINSPVPVICQAGQCPNGTACTTNSDCKATGAAVYGIAGDPSSDSYAAYFGGRVYISSLPLKAGFNNLGRLCLGGFEPPDADAVGGPGECISSWLEVASGAGIFVTLQPANPPIPPPVPQLSGSLGGAAVAGSSKFSSVVLGDSKCFTKNSATCGNGYCDPGGTAAECGVIVPAETAASCAIDCAGIVSPVILSAILTIGEVTVTIKTVSFGAPPPVTVILTRAKGTPTFQPVDGVSYTTGQIIGNTTIVYVGLKGFNVTFPTTDVLPGSGDYTYRAYQANAYPRYSLPHTVNLNGIDQLSVVTNVGGIGSIADLTYVIDCYPPNPAKCKGLFNRGEVVTLFREVGIPDWDIVNWQGCVRSPEFCTLTMNGDTQVRVNFVYTGH